MSAACSRRMMPIPWPVCVLLLVLSLFFPPPSRADRQFTFCVHPYLPASEIQERFTPLVSYLSRRLGIPVQLKIAKDYQNHIHMSGKENKDFCFLGPASYVKLTGAYGKQQLLGRLETAGKPSFRGVVFVAEESRVRRLSDLAGKRFAFGDPESTMSCLVPRYLLSKSGIPLDKLSGHSFLSNHDNIVLGVLMGDFDAGAIMQDVFDEFKDRGLRAIAETPEISEHVFVAGKNVPPAIMIKTKQVLLNMHKSEEGRKALRSIKSSITSVVPAQDSNYDNLREILNELKKTGVSF